MAPPAPLDAIKGTRQDNQQGKQKSNTARQAAPSSSKLPPPTDAPTSDIAPWMNDDLPAISTHGLTSANFLNDGPPKLQLSSSSRPDTGDSDSPDPMFLGLADERRPSVATSATTESSQTSLSKTSTNMGTPYKKVTGMFSDDGRQSSRSSDTSIPNMLQREQTASSRHGSLHTRHTSGDDGRGPNSPTNSRPRTPAPSSDITPWLFQDYKVRRDVRYPAMQSLRLHFSSNVVLDFEALFGWASIHSNHHTTKATWHVKQNQTTSMAWNSLHIKVMKGALTGAKKELFPCSGTKPCWMLHCGSCTSEWSRV